jgi:hypothetical protein
MSVALLWSHAAVAEELKLCGAGKSRYYVLWREPTQEPIPLYDYTLASGNMLWFPGEDEPRYRQVHEMGRDGGTDVVLYHVCEAEVPAFEAAHQIASYKPLAGELHAVRDSWGGRIGTVFKDSQTPYALGGGVAIQQFYVCNGTPPSGAVIGNSTLYHSGLDRDGINDAREDVKQIEYLDRVEERLDKFAERHMLEHHGCGPIGEAQFLALSANGTEFQIHYDVSDPKEVPEVWE